MPARSDPPGATTCPHRRMAAGEESHRAQATALSKCREPASATAVNEPGSGSSADGKVEEGIDRSFERAGAPLRMGEQKPSFERGEESNGEVVRVNAGRKFPLGMKGPESVADGGCPLIEPGRDERAGLGVALGELANERAKCAAPLRLGALRGGDHHLPPGLDSVRAAEGLPVATDDAVGIVADDRLHEV